MTKRKTTRIDMHTHTRGSDGWGTPAQYVEAIRKSGIDGLVITDHHKTKTKEGIEVARAVQAAGYFAMLGCEYSTAQGHLLVYGVDVDTLHLGRYPQMQDAIHCVLDHGGVAIPAHPFKGYRYSLQNDIYFLDGIGHVETFNGQNQVRQPHTDRRAKEAARTLQLQRVGGSDAHQADRVGIAWTEFDGIITTPEQLLDALKHGTCRARRARQRILAERESRQLYLAEQDARYKQWHAASPQLDSQPSFWNGWELDSTRGNDYQDSGTEGPSDEDIPWWAYQDEEDQQSKQQSWAEEAAEVQRALVLYQGDKD